MIKKREKKFHFGTVVIGFFSCHLEHEYIKPYKNLCIFSNAAGRSIFAVIKWNLGSFSPLLEMGVRKPMIMGVNSSRKTNIGTVTWLNDKRLSFKANIYFFYAFQWTQL